MNIYKIPPTLLFVVDWTQRNKFDISQVNVRLSGNSRGTVPLTKILSLFENRLYGYRALSEVEKHVGVIAVLTAVFYFYSDGYQALVSNDEGVVNVCVKTETNTQAFSVALLKLKPIFEKLKAELDISPRTLGRALSPQIVFLLNSVVESDRVGTTYSLSVSKKLWIESNGEVFPISKQESHFLLPCLTGCPELASVSAKAYKILILDNRQNEQNFKLKSKHKQSELKIQRLQYENQRLKELLKKQSNPKKE